MQALVRALVYALGQAAVRCFHARTRAGGHTGSRAGACAGARANAHAGARAGTVQALVRRR